MMFCRTFIIIIGQQRETIVPGIEDIPMLVNVK